jgi:tetratricopeptide (TPR) repeat protein
VLEAGDGRAADEAFALGDRLAHELGQPTLMWTAGWNRAAWLARHGRLRDAEDAITATRELGHATGQLDADAFFVVQIAPVLREQGRLGELDDVLRDACDRWPLEVFRAYWAQANCELGRKDDARAIFDAFFVDRVPQAAMDFVWMMTMTTWASVATDLGSVHVMVDLANALSPFADQVVVIACIPCGATVHHLGVLAAALGDLDRAEEYLTAAAAVHERMGLPTWMAHTALERGAVLLRRDEPGDRERAVSLVEQALAGAAEYGLGGDERRARALLEEARSP